MKTFTLAELERMLADATPGPWGIGRGGRGLSDKTVRCIGPLSADEYCGVSWLDVTDADAALIEASFDLATALHAALSALEELERGLKDPVAVHINMLRGSIAKPSWENIKHLYPVEFAALVREQERDAEVAKLREALVQIAALDDMPECCGVGTTDGYSPQQCCGSPYYGLDRAKFIARRAAALSQIEAPKGGE